MRRLVLLALVPLLVLGAIAPASALASDPTLPTVGADGYSRPLTADQLSPEERARFDQFLPDSDDARKFLYTRGFLRLCRLVLEQKLAPIDLPQLPVRANWNRQFLSEHEAADVVDVALGMRFEALMYARPR